MIFLLATLVATSLTEAELPINASLIGGDNGLLVAQREAIICTNDSLFCIGPLATCFAEIAIKIPKH